MSCSIVLWYYWEAMLISYLANVKVILPFNGIETLIANSDFKIAIWPGTYSQGVFENSLDPIWKNAWSSRMKPYIEEYRPYAGKIMIKCESVYLKATCIYFSKYSRGHWYGTIYIGESKFCLL